MNFYIVDYYFPPVNWEYLSTINQNYLKPENNFDFHPINWGRLGLPPINKDYSNYVNDVDIHWRERGLEYAYPLYHRFVYFYNIIKETNKNINEEIINLFYHPSIIESYLEDGNELDEIYTEIESYSSNNVKKIFEVIKSIK